MAVELSDSAPQSPNRNTPNPQKPRPYTPNLTSPEVSDIILIRALRLAQSQERTVLSYWTQLGHVSSCTVPTT